MEPLTISKYRDIIEDFAIEIKKRRRIASPPKTCVINFRNENKKNEERPVWEVPIELLRYRKDNGRIASDVASEEKLHGPLLERDQKTQEILAAFLERKDKDLTEILKKSLKHAGQTSPACFNDF